MDDLADEKNIICALEINLNIMAFVAASMFFVQTFSAFLYAFMPIFMVTQCYLMFFILHDAELTSNYSFCVIVFVYILTICLITAIGVYRWLLTCLTFDMLKIEESGQVHQLNMVLNKQTDGIALIE